MVNGSCREWCTPVYNQENEGTCAAIAFTEMTEMTLVMSNPARRGLKLSPQSMIDVVGVNHNPIEISKFICSPHFGLEEEYYNQFINVSRQLTVPRFQLLPDQRFRLRQIGRLTRQNEIKDSLVNMFREGGDKFPCVVGVRMYGFTSQIAAEVARGSYRDPITGEVGALYRPTQQEITEFETEKRPGHALLVVGVNTEHEDARFHYCWVKNSYGPNWGIDGYSKIPFDFIRRLYVPVP